MKFPLGEEASTASPVAVPAGSGFGPVSAGAALVAIPGIAAMALVPAAALVSSAARASEQKHDASSAPINIFRLIIVTFTLWFGFCCCPLVKPPVLLFLLSG